MQSINHDRDLFEMLLEQIVLTIMTALSTPLNQSQTQHIASHVAWIKRYYHLIVGSKKKWRNYELINFLCESRLYELEILNY